MQIDGHRLGDSRLLYLQDHGSPVREYRAVGLADAGRRERLLLDRLERALELLFPDLLLQDLLDAAKRDRRNAIEKNLELLGNRLAGNVGTGRENLTELDESRAELHEKLRQFLAEDAIERNPGRTLKPHDRKSPFSDLDAERSEPLRHAVPRDRQSNLLRP